MDPGEFRKFGYRLVDWVADYLDNAERYPVLSPASPGDIRAQLPDEPPGRGEPMEQILTDFDKIVMPGVTHWNHPRFFAYFPANHSGPAILGELLSAGLGVNGMVWQSCPAATELEQVTMDWLRQMIGLPQGFLGSIQDTASTATLCALLCARERASDFSTNLQGTTGRMRVYASAEAHSSVEKAAKIAGFGSENLVKVAVDGSLAMDPEDLARLIRVDRGAGLSPCCVVATVGSTSSTAIDPLKPIGKLCEENDLWMHVDAALAGSAAILPEMRWLLDGVESCHSFVFNPHKWMFVNFDCSALFCREPEVLTRTMTIDPEYLKTDRDRQVTNYRDWGIQLGRRFRSLKLWFVLRYYGVEGLQHMLREHLELAREFKGWVTDSPDFELLAPVPLQTVCFRFNPGGLDEKRLDAINKALMDAVNRSGRIFITHTRLHGKFCLRLSIGQLATRHQHVEEAWRILNEFRPGNQ